jgi:hypothetical protein
LGISFRTYQYGNYFVENKNKKTKKEKKENKIIIKEIYMNVSEKDESLNNAINEYYKLKTSYEEQVNKTKKKIIGNPDYSWKEKRAKYQEIKPKCINCKCPGGTIFSTKYYDENDAEYRQLKAICGVIVNPCSLNITINVGKYSSLTDVLKEFETEISQIKKNIIEYKNKLLFGFVTTEEALRNFTNLKSLLSDYTTYSHTFLEEYIDIVNNSEDKRILNEDLEKSYILIDEMKKNIEQFNESNNLQFVKDMVTTYNTNLRPLLIKIRNEKYKENSVYYNEDTNTYHLIQEKNTIQELEFNEGEKGVVQFHVGHIESKKCAVAETEEVPVQKQKRVSTKKALKAKKEQIEAEAEAESNADLSLQSGGNELQIMQTFPEEWKNTEYEKIWETLKPDFQNALLKDKEWLETFMRNCTNQQKMEEPCSFVSPPNLIIPPQIIDADTNSSGQQYDFGNETYNSYFNSLDKTQQSALLQLFTMVDGTKNYEMLEEHLANEMSNLFGILPPNSSTNSE